MTAPTLEQQADAFREARIALGLTQMALAFRTGFSESAIRAWESGRNRPHPAAVMLMRLWLDAEGKEVTL